MSDVAHLRLCRAIVSPKENDLKKEIAELKGKVDDKTLEPFVLYSEGRFEDASDLFFHLWRGNRDVKSRPSALVFWGIACLSQLLHWRKLPEEVQNAMDSGEFSKWNLVYESWLQGRASDPSFEQVLSVCWAAAELLEKRESVVLEIEKRIREIFNRFFPGVELEDVGIRFSCNVHGKKYLDIDFVLKPEAVRVWKRLYRENPARTCHYRLAIHDEIIMKYNLFVHQITDFCYFNGPQKTHLAFITAYG